MSIEPTCSMRCAPISSGERLDHIAVTGDLTHLGLPHEFRQAAAWLDRLGPPDAITVVPGNHDAYVRESWQDTFAQWSAYIRGDDARDDAEGDEVFPTLRLRRDVALIGLSTARPSAPFLATGRLGERQLAELDRMLDETGSDGRFRIVLLHHPPGRHTVRWRKSLRDGAALRDVLARRGAELVLHGHAHFSAATYLDAARGRNLAIGVPSGFGDRQAGRSIRGVSPLSHPARRSRMAPARFGARVFARTRALRSRRRTRPSPGARDGAGLMLRRRSAARDYFAVPVGGRVRRDSWARRLPSRRRAP